MRKIPPALRAELLSDEYYKTCARSGEDCKGRITWEHAFMYGGKQINERWAIIPLCAYHHAVNEHQDGRGLNKGLNQLIALSRATPADLAKYPRVNWAQKKKWLESA